MKIALSQNILLDLPCLILAILIHFVIGSLFVFSIPLQKIPEKPTLIFWGSFLSSIEQPFLTRSTSAKKETSLIIVPYYQPPGPQTRPVKPAAAYTFLLEKPSKPLQKTTFLRQEPPASIYTYPYSNEYQKTKIKYQPLQLQPVIP